MMCRKYLRGISELLTTEHRWVTDLREGGDVRGSLLPLEWYLYRVVNPFAGVY